jgi:hypothetical protein
MVHPVEKGALDLISRAMPAASGSSDEFGNILQSAATSPSKGKGGIPDPSDRWFSNAPVEQAPATSAGGGVHLQAPASELGNAFGNMARDKTVEVTSPAVSSSTGAKQPIDSASSDANGPTVDESGLGEPDIQSYLNQYWSAAEQPNAGNISYPPAQGAGDNYPAGSVYGPDAVYTQAVANQIGNFFAGLAGSNPASLTSQLPGIPRQQVQQQFDQTLALENANRLASGQPIDTSAYWGDPGPVSLNGVTYTSQELGYVGPGQSSGPQPIFISVANLVPGTTGTFSVGGYSGTVTGIQAGRYYTLQQLEQAGLPARQPDTQFQPGSWSTTQDA